MRYSSFLPTLLPVYRKIHLTFIILFLGITVLTACGKKGGLFLPAEPISTAVEPAKRQTETPLDLGVSNDPAASTSAPVSQVESQDNTKSKKKPAGQ